MKKSVIVTILVLMLLLGTFLIAQAASVPADLISGNPKCQDLGYAFGFKPQPEPPPTGTYNFTAPATGETVAITYDPDGPGGGILASWTASFPISAVIVKGGPNANVYKYNPPVTGDTELSTPTNPNNNKLFGVSHIDFCYDMAPTAIDLSSFEVNAETGAATITWETGTEIDNAGFNLYRATSPDGPWVQINEALIPAEGDPVTGAVYTFADKPGRGNYYYRLEDVDYFGVSTLHEAVMDADLGPTIRAPWFRPSLPWIRPSLSEF